MQPAHRFQQTPPPTSMAQHSGRELGPWSQTDLNPQPYSDTCWLCDLGHLAHPL